MQMFVHMCVSHMSFVHMLRLIVSNFIDAFDKEKYKTHKTMASRMDINDSMEPRFDFLPVVEEPMPKLETNDDKPFPSQHGAGMSPMPLFILREFGFEDIMANKTTSMWVLPPHPPT